MIAISREQLGRVVVAVDPAVTSGDNADETGIIVVARGPHQPETCHMTDCEGHAYVLADCTADPGIRPTVAEWARLVVKAFDDWAADRVVAEGNQGGELVESILRTVRPSLPITRVTARVGKRTRAEPVAALYEQGRVHHVGSALSFSILEDQLTSWTPDSGESPDRLDALVWGVTALGLTATDWSDGGFVPVGFGKRNEFDFGGLR